MTNYEIKKHDLELLKAGHYITLYKDLDDTGNKVRIMPDYEESD